MDQRKTTKITIEDDLAKVEAIAARLRQFFTVTYESRDTHIARSLKVRRYLHLLLPEEAHREGETNG